MHKLRVTVDARAYEVTVEILDETPAGPSYSSAWVPHAQPPPNPPPAAAVSAGPASAPAGTVCPAADGTLLSPLAGKVVAVDVRPGMKVAAGAQVVTLEAMKMNTFVYASRAGTVTAVHINPGDAVEEGTALLTIA